MAESEDPDESIQSVATKVKDDEGKTSLVVLIDHYRLMWESERQDGERLSRHAELLSGAMIALLGFGFFSIQWFYQPPAVSLVSWPKYFVTAVHGILILVVVMFGRALAVLYTDHQSVKLPTETLELHARDAERPCRNTILVKLFRAYNFLKVANEDRRRRIKTCQKWFAAGLLLLLVSIIGYLILSIGPKIYLLGGR